MYRRSSLPEPTPEARRKQRIGGGLLYVAIAFNLVATLLPGGPAYHTLAVSLLAVGVSCLIASIVYMILARRAS